MSKAENSPGLSEALKSDTVRVNFACQRCYQPLKLDHSFEQIDEPLYNEITAPLTTAVDGDGKSEGTAVQKVQEEEEPDVCRKFVPVRRPPVTASGFILIGESDAFSDENISRTLKVTSHLFDHLSGQAEIDHPLCEECTDQLLDCVDQQLHLTEKECKDYVDFLDHRAPASAEQSGTGTEEEQLDSTLRQLAAEQAMLEQQLRSVEAETSQLKEQTAAEKNRIKEMEDEEQRHYLEYNEYKRQSLEYEEALKSVDNQLLYAQKELDKLKQTNVFNATFHIWHDGPFGTINSFRLGRSVDPKVVVEYAEVNAAWGQTVLLVNALANKVNLTFKRYRLVPYGNHSYIEVLGDKNKELPLYRSAGIFFTWDSRFDQGMAAFLDCVQQLQTYVEEMNGTTIMFPHKIDTVKGRVLDLQSHNNFSIKQNFNSDEQWTKACKGMLTNIKWIMAWVVMYHKPAPANPGDAAST